MSIAEQIVESLGTGTRLAPAARRSVRSYAAIIDGKQRKIVRCDGCQSEAAFPARTLRELRAAGRRLLCDYCKNPDLIRVTQTHRNYWLKRFTAEERLELAEGIFGPRNTWD